MGITIGPSKSEAMVYWFKDEVLPQVKEFKHLMVLLTDRLGLWL